MTDWLTGDGDGEKYEGETGKIHGFEYLLGWNEWRKKTCFGGVFKEVEKGLMVFSFYFTLTVDTGHSTSGLLFVVINCKSVKSQFTIHNSNIYLKKM